MKLIRTAPSLRFNFAWTFAGNVVYALCQWALIAMMAKWGGAAMVGQYSLGLAVTAPVFMLANLQLRSIQATDSERQYAFGDYMGLRLCTSVLSVAVIAAIMAMNRHSWEMTAVVLLIGCSKAIESVSDVVYGMVQQRERLDLIAKSLLVKGPLSLLTTALLLWTTGSLVVCVAGLCAVWLLVLVAADMRYGARFETLKPRLRLQQLRSLAKLSFPLGIVMMLISLTDALPRYFIESILGTETLGFYASLAYFIVAGSTVMGALGQTASPRLARYYAERRTADYKRLLWRMGALAAGLGAAGTVVAAVAGKPILALVYTPEYAAYGPLLVWMMGYAAISYAASCLGYGMTAARLFAVQPYIFALTALASFLSLWQLVPLHGVYGAVYSLMIAGGVQAAASAAVVAYAVRKNRKREGDRIVATTA
ncbi:lipopolysaccharide biosynthesis protein [Paenibacillus sp. MSJ-34]|uniref:lipopolysaccharide biosynthesis protein n=1 Tax=Paenibacillus sp. MSJ-34 TaxID=2841529 RepID=UPI001C106CF5|nr:oligosaccharide flippase family protein [Paenibacillus sp. MSJ-34]MBU5443474.1 oligosaccharide flippase family protein [Paenibacillus sp. MSJ-34]